MIETRVKPTTFGLIPPLDSNRHMMVLAFRLSVGRDSERISWRQKRIAPAIAVATYTQKDLCHTPTATNNVRQGPS
jgi:hypothetical protein